MAQSARGKNQASPQETKIVEGFCPIQRQYQNRYLPDSSEFVSSATIYSTTFVALNVFTPVEGLRSQTYKLFDNFRGLDSFFTCGYNISEPTPELEQYRSETMEFVPDGFEKAFV
ncbi:hypothetical protein TWF281_002296 [Arthrobotrys megalospora]